MFSSFNKVTFTLENEEHSNWIFYFLFFFKCQLYFVCDYLCHIRPFLIIAALYIELKSILSGWVLNSLKFLGVMERAKRKKVNVHINSSNIHTYISAGRSNKAMFSLFISENYIDLTVF